MKQIKFSIIRSRALTGEGAATHASVESKFYLDKNEYGHYKHGKYTHKDGSYTSDWGCQLFLGATRVGIEDLDYSLWNHVIAIDVDVYKWWANKEERKNKLLEQDFYNRIHANLEEMCANYYFLQRTSKGGLHIYFAYDCEIKNREQFCALYGYTFDQVKNVFVTCGLEEVWNYEGVADDCTKTPTQPTFFTTEIALINKYAYAEGWARIDSDEVFDTYVVKDNKTYKKDDCAFDYVYDKHPLKNGVKVPYLPHLERRTLVHSLLHICHDMDEFQQEWRYCCEHLEEGNGHTYEEYLSMGGIETEKHKNKFDWLKNFNRCSYIDKEMLRKFGYYVEAHRHNVPVCEQIAQVLEEYKNILG